LVSGPMVLLLTVYVLDLHSLSGAIRFRSQSDARISATSRVATRPTINKAGAGSLSSLASRATLDHRTCCSEPLARETITHGRSAGSPPASNRSETSP